MENKNQDKRKGLSKKIRFEVFKRDNFTCQYCGRKAPEIILEVDHICPVAKGGDNSITNLITSCRDCNRGKGKRTLTQKEEIEIQQKALEELNERREQLEMMLEWKQELENFDNELVRKIEELLEKNNIFLNTYGETKLINYIKKFGFEETYEATKISISQYSENDSEENKEKVFHYIPRICAVRRMQIDKPYIKFVYYCAKIIENKIGPRGKNEIKKRLSSIIGKIYFMYKDFEGDCGKEIIEDSMRELQQEFIEAKNREECEAIIKEWEEEWSDVDEPL